MPYRPGDFVRDLEVLRLLGRGANGEVQLVRGPARTGAQPYALKVLPCDSHALGKAEREAAYAEASLLRRLRHPNIVGCLNVFWDEEQQSVQLLLEYLDGGDLQGLLEAQRQRAEAFEAHFARRVTAAVGGALAYVHEAGILHRDVKPANVLLAKNSQRIKLADFGIAKLLETTSHAKTVVGTPFYMSPELVSGEAYGEASDAWALGVCLYEVAALRRPFEASNQLALVRRIAEEAPPELPGSTAPDVRRVVEGLLAKDPFRRLRLQDALAASDAIAALVATGEPPAVANVSAGGVGTASGCQDFRDDADAQASNIVAAVTADAAAHARRTLDDGAGSEASDESVSGTGWAEVEAALRGCSSQAAAAARAALTGDVDDPEELVQALSALERERSATGDAPSGATEALEQELRLRIAALRADAAAMLDGLLALESDAEDEGGAREENPQDDSGGKAGEEDDELGCGQVPDPPELERFGSCRSCAASALEEALEVATTLGVNTEASEECVAIKRGMLSLRVVWGSIARFCMLPVSVGYESLVAEVSRRFGLASGTPLPDLSWREAGESFELNSQARWEECLQRRGLLAQPGRLELCVNSDLPPPAPRLTAHQRVVIAARRAAQEIQASAAASILRQDSFTFRTTATRLPARRGTGRFGTRSPSGMLTHLDAALACSEARHAAAVRVQNFHRESLIRRQDPCLEASVEDDGVYTPAAHSSTLTSALAGRTGTASASAAATARGASGVPRTAGRTTGTGGGGPGATHAPYATTASRRVISGFGSPKAQPPLPTANASVATPVGLGGTFLQINGKALPRQ